MMSVELAIRYTKQIEGLLETALGAIGQNLHHKCTSVERLLDPEIVRKIQHVATLRNKLVYKQGYNLEPDSAVFLSSCEQIIRHLSQIQSENKEVARVHDENWRKYQSQVEAARVNANKWSWGDLGPGLFVGRGWCWYDSFLERYEVPLVLMCGVIVGPIAAHDGMSYGFVAISVIGGAFLGLLSSIILKVLLFLTWLGTIVAVLVAVSMLLSKLF